MDPHYLTLDASTIHPMTWATNYSYDQAQATRPESFQFGENNNHVFDFSLEPTPHAQWCYPVDDGAYEDAHAPSASSKSISWGLPHEGHQTLSASSYPLAPPTSFESTFPWDGSMPLFDFGCPESESSMPSGNSRSDGMDVEAKQSRTVMEHNTEASRGEHAIFVPDIVPVQTQPGSVRIFFFLQLVHLSSI